MHKSSSSSFFIFFWTSITFLDIKFPRDNLWWCRSFFRSFSLPSTSFLKSLYYIASLICYFNWEEFVALSISSMLSTLAASRSFSLFRWRAFCSFCFLATTYILLLKFKGPKFTIKTRYFGACCLIMPPSVSQHASSPTYEIYKSTCVNLPGSSMSTGILIFLPVMTYSQVSLLDLFCLLTMTLKAMAPRFYFKIVIWKGFIRF